jgi:hypothetical protein
LKYVGVVGTKWKRGLNVERSALQFLSDALASEGLEIGLLPEDSFVPMTVQMVDNADVGIAYLTIPDADRMSVRDAVQSLAQTIAAQIGLEAPPLGLQGAMQPRRRA